MLCSWLNLPHARRGLIWNPKALKATQTDIHEMERCFTYSFYLKQSCLICEYHRLKLQTHNLTKITYRQNQITQKITIKWLLLYFCVCHIFCPSACPNPVINVCIKDKLSILCGWGMLISKNMTYTSIYVPISSLVDGCLFDSSFTCLSVTIIKLHYIHPWYA